MLCTGPPTFHDGLAPHDSFTTQMSHLCLLTPTHKAALEVCAGNPTLSLRTYGRQPRGLCNNACRGMQHHIAWALWSTDTGWCATHPCHSAAAHHTTPVTGISRCGQWGVPTHQQTDNRLALLLSPHKGSPGTSGLLTI